MLWCDLSKTFTDVWSCYSVLVWLLLQITSGTIILTENWYVYR